MSEFVVSAKLIARNELSGPLKAVDADLKQVKASTHDVGAASATAATGMGGLTRAFQQVQAGARAEKAALDAATQAARTKQQSMRMLGIQMGDFGQQVAVGINPIIAMAQQMGQLGLAAEGLGGRMGRFATFMSSPWGAVIQTSAILLGTLGMSFLRTGKQAEDSAKSTDFHRMSVDALSKAIDAQREALERKTLTARESEAGELQAALDARHSARERLADARATLQQALAQEKLQAVRAQAPGQRGDVAAVGLTGRAGQLQDLIKKLEGDIADADRVVALAATPLQQRNVAARLDAATAATERYNIALAKLNRDRRDGLNGMREQVKYEAELFRIGQLRDKQLKAAQEAGRTGRTVNLGSQLDIALGGNLLRTARGYEGLNERSDKSALMALFREANINVDPAMVKWCAAFVNAVLATQGLHGTGKLNARSFLGWGEETNSPTKGDIVVLRRGKSQDEGHVGFFAGQDARGRILVTGGNQGNSVSTDAFNRADVLAFRRAPSAAQDYAADVRETEQALRELQAELGAIVGAFDPARAAAEKYADQLERIRKLAPDSVLNPGGKGVISDAQAITMSLEAARQEEARIKSADAALIDRVFGGDFSKAYEATMAEANERVGRNAGDRLEAAGRRGAEAFEGRGLEAAEAIARLLGGKIGASAGDVFGILGGLKTGNFNSINSPLGSVLTLLSGGQRKPGEAPNPFNEGLRDFVNPLKKGLKEVVAKIGDTFKIGGDFEKTLGHAAAGAALGAVVGPAVTKLLGIRGSKAGGEIGGAIGAAAGQASGIPGGAQIGSIIGSIEGSIIGGLFKKAKTGSASLTSIYGDPSISGNNANAKAAATALGSNLQANLAQIADLLGGQLGSFAVSIGMKDGNFRVDPTGKGNVKTKKGALDFGKDQAAAEAAALRVAIVGGAVMGLSEKVLKALQSSTNIDKALREALKVQEVEDLLADLGGTMAKQFRDYERQAAERLRIAKQYGFDVVAVEKRNAEDRVKLTDEILGARIGSLKTLLEDMKLGSLFEGSFVDQRKELLAERDKALADAEKGLDGAADKLADLSRRLLELDRNAFGTAGPELSGDLAATRTAAEHVIQLENERLANATDLAKETNKKLDENNNQNAEMIARLNSLDLGMKALVAANAAVGGLLSGGAKTGFSGDLTLGGK